MENFDLYQIRELKKQLEKCVSKEFSLDFEFVLYCEKYISFHGKLNRDLYIHLNDLFWKYHD